MKTIVNVPTKQSLIRETRDYLMIALGLILYGIGWTVFLLPNDITTGGVPGIASIVYFATGFPVQYTYFSINFILLLLSIRILGWKFSIKTVFAVFTLTFFLSIIQRLASGVVLLHDQPFMACVIGASLCGGGIGIAFSSNGSTGGTDIIAAIIIDNLCFRKKRCKFLTMLWILLDQTYRHAIFFKLLSKIIAYTSAAADHNMIDLFCYNSKIIKKCRQAFC